MKPYVGVYPSPATSSPIIWGPDFKHFLPPVFAVYFEPQECFVIYETKVADIYHIIRPYESDRSEPFYLHTTGNPATHPLEVYMVNAQVPFCIWYQQAWLCRKNGTGMSPLVPVMRATTSICKYRKYYSVQIYESPAAKIWVDQYKTIDHWLNRLATQISNPIPHRPILEEPATPSTPLPTFVRDLLIDHAIKEGSSCSITLEPLTKESAVVTSCFHIFDRTAITEWLEVHTTCPVCKQETHL
jgi:hypothetical protein